MFTSGQTLQKRTPANGLDRFHFLEALVGEYRSAATTNDARLQVIANLANFAYDPINYEHFRKLGILDIFLDIIASPRDNIQATNFAVGGICNLCLDYQNKQYLLTHNAVDLVSNLLHIITEEETRLNTISTLMFLATPQSQQSIARETTLSLIQTWASQDTNRRLKNLSLLFLEQFQTQ